MRPFTHPHSMNLTKYIYILFALQIFFFLSPVIAADNFTWPEKNRAALSLTFDDARESQLDVGVPLFNSNGIQVTFYVLPGNVKTRIADWQKAAAAGHEIGNHTITHPCSGNHQWSRENALEDRSLRKMSHEIEVANEAAETMLNITPRSFAYPCGQTFVGRGKDIKSYVPLIAERFQTGRTYGDEVANDPVFCDLSKLTGIKSDNLSWEKLRILVDKAIEEGSWLILVGHEIGTKNGETTSAAALAALLEYVKSPQKKMWIAPVDTIGMYVASQRTKGTQNQNQTNKQGNKLPKQYINVLKILGAGLLGFLVGFLISLISPAKMSKFLLVSCTVLLLLFSVWSIRDGYIGPQGLIPIFATLGCCIGFSSINLTKKQNDYHLK